MTGMLTYAEAQVSLSKTQIVTMQWWTIIQICLWLYILSYFLIQR